VAALGSDARIRFLHSLDPQSFRAEFARRDCIGCSREGDRTGIRRRHVVVIRGAHGDVDIFEDLTRGDAEDSVIRLDEVIAFAAAVLAAEVIDEGEAGAELFGFDQEPRAVSFPFSRFHGATRVFVVRLVAVLKRIILKRIAGWNSSYFFVRGEGECTREMARGQSNIFGAIEEKRGGGFSQNFTGQVAAQRCVVAGGSAVVFELRER
jgi:hypothetical protein